MTTITPYNQSLITTTTNPVVNGAATGSMISAAIVFNTDTTARTVTAYLVPNGGAVATSNEVIVAIVSSGKTRALPLNGQGLANGNALFMKASASNKVVLALTTVTP